MMFVVKLITFFLPYYVQRRELITTKTRQEDDLNLKSCWECFFSEL